MSKNKKKVEKVDNVENVEKIEDLNEIIANNKHKINVRINKLIGQMIGVKRLVEEERNCYDILVQLSSVDSSIKSLANIMIENNIQANMLDGLKDNNQETLKELFALIKLFQ
ncbi:MAG: metal-sensitive transcriptional regulator [Christensenellales bacterium]